MGVVFLLGVCELFCVVGFVGCLFRTRIIFVGCVVWAVVGYVFVNMLVFCGLYFSHPSLIGWVQCFAREAYVFINLLVFCEVSFSHPKGVMFGCCDCLF